MKGKTISNPRLRLLISKIDYLMQTRTAPANFTARGIDRVGDVNVLAEMPGAFARGKKAWEKKDGVIIAAHDGLTTPKKTIYHDLLEQCIVDASGGSIAFVYDKMVDQSNIPVFFISLVAVVIPDDTKETAAITAQKEADSRADMAVAPSLASPLVEEIAPAPAENIGETFD
jgi:hypothetical protein